MTARTALERARSAAPSLAVAISGGLAAVGGSYATAGFTPAFVVSPIDGFVSQVMPGIVITFAITVLGDLGQQLALVAAVATTAGLFAAVTYVAVAIGRRRGEPLMGVTLSGAGGYLLAVGLTGAPVAAIGAIAAAAVVAASILLTPRTSRGPEPDRPDAERRRVLGSAATAIGIGVLSLLFQARGQVGGTESGSGPGSPLPTESAGATGGDSPTRADLLSQADQQSLDLPGAEPLVSENFYTVDINNVDPDPSAEEWELTVTGAVDEPYTVDYEDVTSMPAEDRFVTLRCVGENLNGKKMDTALWTGVPLMDVIEEAGIPEECCVMLRAADDYYESFPLEALRGGFLAYGMNGNRLPRSHGYPVRVLIPGHWGEINVKWLTEIEVLEEKQDGYWEQKGWHGTGPVKTVAKLHSVDKREDGTVRVGGHAYAGTRGIDAVEVSTDGGDSWTDARLSDPLPGEDVWRQWVHEFETNGEHEVVVRAIDGEGTVQPQERTDPFPSGPSGWVTRTISN